MIERYDSLFGRERVIVLPYEELRRDRARLLASLSMRLGITLPAGEGEPVNSGYRASLLPLLRLANLFTRRSVIDKTVLLHLPYWYTVRKALFEKLNRSRLFGRRLSPDTLLSSETMAWIAQRYWRSNRWLEGRMGIDLAPLGYPLDPPPAKLAPPARTLPLRWASN